jgi:UDP-N-acetylglucosamine transferase subunit ALG13
MIFVSVGSQLPFDRLVRTVDEWAERNQRVEVFAQIGRSSYRPRRLQWSCTLDPPEFQRRIEDAHAVIAHAGMGTILKAWELGKPILVMPRRAELGEVLNDHQVSTARRLAEQGRIAVAMDELQLVGQLDSLGRLRPSARIAGQASPELIGALASFVRGGGLGIAGTPGGAAAGALPPVPTGGQA